MNESANAAKWNYQFSNSFFGNTYKDRAQNFVDNSYVKIKNITLGYTFPKNWLQKLHISNLRVFANILNPLTFTSYKGFDPEWADAEVGDGTGGVSSRSWQFGINLKF